MKALFLFFVLVGSVTSTLAMADWDRDHDRGWDRRPPPHWGGGRCVVRFQKCDFSVNNFCVKWNNKAFQVNRYDARWACERAYREYGMIRRCYVDCN